LKKSEEEQQEELKRLEMRLQQQRYKILKLFEYLLLIAFFHNLFCFIFVCLFTRTLIAAYQQLPLFQQEQQSNQTQKMDLS